MNRLEKIEQFLRSLNTEIDILNIVDIESITDYQTLYEAIENNSGFDIDVIYYSTAIEFLKEYDPSLRDSLQLASDMGYSLENLSSEILASLLKSDIVREEFSELEDEINEFFSDLEVEESDEEE